MRATGAQCKHFNPRAPCGARLRVLVSLVPITSNFNPRAPCGARRAGRLYRHQGLQISTHAPLAGRDRRGLAVVLVDRRISTHAPLAGRDYSYGCLSRGNFVFQPTRPLRGATEIDVSAQLVGIRISTHAPLAGRDIQAAINNGKEEYFNPRAPCGARLRHNKPFNLRQNFNPRAPCGARPEDVLRPIYTVVISTHAPLAGRDQ